MLPRVADGTMADGGDVRGVATPATFFHFARSIGGPSASLTVTEPASSTKMYRHGCAQLCIGASSMKKSHPSFSGRSMSPYHVVIVLPASTGSGLAYTHIPSIFSFNTSLITMLFRSSWEMPCTFPMSMRNAIRSRSIVKK